MFTNDFPSLSSPSHVPASLPRPMAKGAQLVSQLLFRVSPCLFHTLLGRTSGASGAGSTSLASAPRICIALSALSNGQYVRIVIEPIVWKVVHGTPCLGACFEIAPCRLHLGIAHQSVCEEDVIILQDLLHSS